MSDIRDLIKKNISLKKEIEVLKEEEKDTYLLLEKSYNELKVIKEDYEKTKKEKSLLSLKIKNSKDEALELKKEIQNYKKLIRNISTPSSKEGKEREKIITQEILDLKQELNQISNEFKNKKVFYKSTNDILLRKKVEKNFLIQEILDEKNKIEKEVANISKLNEEINEINFELQQLMSYKEIKRLTKEHLQKCKESHKKEFDELQKSIIKAKNDLIND